MIVERESSAVKVQALPFFKEDNSVAGHPWIRQSEEKEFQRLGLLLLLALTRQIPLCSPSRGESDAFFQHMLLS